MDPVILCDTTASLKNNELKQNSEVPSIKIKFTSIILRKNTLDKRQFTYILARVGRKNSFTPDHLIKYKEQIPQEILRIIKKNIMSPEQKQGNKSHWEWGFFYILIHLLGN